ncbi:MAG TPA: hypothetical protein VLG44_08200 [Chlamydiales bacterium]|nr:hypothetical protein [Chlamydiales bacterium]
MSVFVTMKQVNVHSPAPRTTGLWAGFKRAKEIASVGNGKVSQGIQSPSQSKKEETARVIQSPSSAKSIDAEVFKRYASLKKPGSIKAKEGKVYIHLSAFTALEYCELDRVFDQKLVISREPV